MRTNEQSGGAFVENLALLEPKDRAAVHDRITALLARRRPSEEPVSGAESRMPAPGSTPAVENSRGGTNKAFIPAGEGRR